MKFSLMFFAASEDDLIKDKYNLVIESAKFADLNGFSGVWVPERHFIKFGYLYPNPAILHSALARETRNIRLMAGSVVAPLHNPIRVAEDWAMVDNLSGGRVGISFAPGWNPDDFVFYPEKYKERHNEMYASIETVKRLWEGGSIKKISGNGKQTEISIYPKPIQKQLPIWVTVSGNPESFAKAGELGANLLTHILDQEANQLAKKITIYRDSLSKNGFDPKSREVTVMIHTFLGANAEEIKEQARKPYCEYMKANRNIFAGLAQSRGNKVNADAMSEGDLDELINYLYDRFASTRGFIGAPDNCFKLLDELKLAGVDEVACLLDFGPHPDVIIKNLPYIKILKQRYNAEAPENDFTEKGDNGAKNRTNSSVNTTDPVKNSATLSDVHGDRLIDIQKRCKTIIDKKEFYNFLRIFGLGFSTKHEIIESVWIGAKESFGNIEIPDEVFALPNFSVNSSVFIDSCFQLFVSSLPAAFSNRSYGYYPSGFKGINIYLPLVKTLWGHARLKSDEDESEFFEGDIDLLDEYGNLVATITSLQLKKIEIGAVKNEDTKLNSMTNHTRRLPLAKLKNTRKYEEIFSDLRSMVGELLQIDQDDLDPHTTFMEMGADSLILAAVMNKVDKKYQVRIAIRQLFEDVNSLTLIAEYIRERLPDELGEASQTDSEMDSATDAKCELNTLPSSKTQKENSQSLPLPNQSDQTILEQIIKQQLQIMSQQLDMLSGNRERNTLSNPALQPLPDAQKIIENKSNTSSSAVNQPSKNTLKPSNQASIFPRKDFKSNDNKGYNTEQIEYLNDFINSYSKKTERSKHLTQSYRHVLADNRASVGFRFQTKEILYPIVGSSSEGAKIWDVDGNEYVDITMGFGVNLFGHRPPFVTKVIEDQLNKGFQLGPQSEIAGEVAQLITELTGMERASFHNSGTEAVMTALRLARTVTGRNKTVVFGGSYHGHFDGTLAVAEEFNENPQAIPMTLGIPQSIVNDVIVLEYGNFQSLEIIKERAHEISAVLVEPVQSRKPDLQPKEFLKSLREITEREKIALIFDEMITGFRIHPGGAQAWFGISADIATYGKIIGGGMPIGIIAGKAKFMDALDGGIWKFGDDSFPQVETTFFAGTFCKHPLAIASARSILIEIKRQGPELQRRLNEKTTYLADSLNAFFKENDLSIHVAHFGSLFYFSYGGNMDMFFYHLVYRGIYVWEGRTCFLSTAHSEKDIEFIISTIKETVIFLLEKGYIKSKSGVLKTASSPSLNIHYQKESPLPEVKAKKERIPLTESQRKIWILAQLEEAGSINNIPVLIQLKGDLDIKVLEETLQIILNRHEALRTVFSEEGDYQTILAEIKFKLVVIDFTSIKDQKEDEILEKWQFKNVTEPFDLVKGPLFKAELLKLNDSHYFLFFATHHIIADGWSMGIVADEIGKIYSALVSENELNLDPPSQFKAYIQTLQSISQSEVMNKQEGYWLNKFAVLPPPLEFIPDHTPPAVKSFRGKRKTKKLDAAIVKELARIGMENQASKHMVLMAAYFTMVHRLTGQHDIAIGMPLAARHSNTFYNMVGCCANMLPMRSIIPSEISFLDLLKLTKNELLLAYENQDFSYGSFLDKLESTRDLIHNPLMELGFNFNPNINHPVFSNLEAKLISPLIAYSENGLIFHVNEIDGELLIECDYSIDLYNGVRIEDLLETYNLFLKTIIRNPEIFISEIPLVSLAEREKILKEWNNISDAFPNESLHELFELQVRRTPEAIAVAFNGKTLTYSELNDSANQLAHYLRKTYFIKPDDLIGLMVDRSEWMIISMLAILKSGAAYIPIDPEYPTARIQYILSNASVKALIVDRYDLKENYLIKEVSIISLKEDWEMIAKSSIKNPTHITSSKHLAYVIYTSGSTGNPKGVMIEHAGLVNKINWMWKHYHFTVQDVILQKSSFAFDISVCEIFLSLCYGAKLVLCRKEVIYDPQQIIDHLHENSITTLHFVPSMLSLFLEAVSERNKYKLKSLRHVMAGGEALPVQTVKTFYKKLSIPLHNLYGPTEASVAVSYYETRDTDIVVPIGQPMSNTKLYVLDKSLKLLPAGYAGEICISGIGLARGYVGLPSLTREKFIENPFIAGEKLYLTGDVGRWLQSGMIEYIGRKDHQVKVKGNRIELGEIENVLASYEGIKKAVVLIVEIDNDKQLAAYLISEKPYDEIEIRSYVGSKLPSYMIPTYFISVDTIPLTANGKIDRKALTSLGDFNSNKPLSTPGNYIEEKLLFIWKEILGKADISMTDNFFAMGGQSLKAIQMMSSIRKELGRKIELRSIFQYPTISMLASYLEKIAGEGAYELIKLASYQPYYDLSQSQKPLWLLAQIEKEFTAYNMFKELPITGEFDKEAFENTIRSIVIRHESLRTSFKMVDGTPKQFIQSVEDIQYTINYIHIEGTGNEREAVTKFSNELDKIVFDLSRTPLFKLFVVHLDESTHIVSLVIHHIISDGLSNDILMEEILKTYTSLKNGKEMNLLPLEIQYKDYSEWQNKLLNSEEGDIHKQYWHKKLDGMLPVLNLPLDFPRGKKTYKGSVYHFTIDIKTSTLLKEFNKEYNSTVFITLLSTINILLSKYTGQQDIILGTPVAGRSSKELENQVGLFINNLPLRIIIDGNLSFVQFVKDNRENMFEAHQHEIYPYVKLVEELNLEYDVDRNPLYDVLVVHVNHKDDIFEKIKILENMKDLRLNHNTSKLDLSFFLAEREEIDVVIEFRSDLFVLDTIKKIAHDFITLINIFLVNPTMLIDDLKSALLSPIKKAEQNAFEYEAAKVVSEQF